MRNAGATDGDAMILCNDAVRLTEDLPAISLHAGDVGTVRASWQYPNVAYEVEFHPDRETVRILLMEDQVLPAQEGEA